MIETLREFGKKVEDSIPTLNHGGCGLYAYMMGEYLKEKGIPDVSCFAIQSHLRMEPEHYSNIVKIYNNKNLNMMEWLDNDVEFHHIGVKFRLGLHMVYHDSSLTIKGDVERWWDMKIVPTSFDVESIKYVAVNDPSEWNPDFNRSTEIPKLKKFFDMLKV